MKPKSNYLVQLERRFNDSDLSVLDKKLKPFWGRQHNPHFGENSEVVQEMIPSLSVSCNNL